MEIKKIEIIRVILKIIMWFLIIEFGCNFIMQTVSYSFYKRTKEKTDITFTPQYLQMTDTLTGYGYNLDSSANKIILFFGGSDVLPMILMEHMQESSIAPLFPLTITVHKTAEGI